MSGHKVEEVFVEIGARLRQGDFVQAYAAFDAFKHIAEKASHVIRESFKKTFEVAKHMAEGFSDISHAASTVGISANEMRQLSYVARMNDVDVSALGKSLKTLERKMYDARNGSKEAAKDFRLLGVSLVEGGKNKSSLEVLGDVADKLKYVHNESEKIALVQKALGKSGTEMIGMLSKGSEILNEQVGEAITHTEEFDEVMEHLDQTIKKKGEVTGEQGILASAFLGEKGEVAHAVDQFMVAWQVMLKSPVISDLLKHLGREMKELLIGLTSVVNKVTEFSSKHPDLMKWLTLFTLMTNALLAFKIGINAVIVSYKALISLAKGFTGGLVTPVVGATHGAPAIMPIGAADAEAAAYGLKPKAPQTTQTAPGAFGKFTGVSGVINLVFIAGIAQEVLDSLFKWSASKDVVSKETTGKIVSGKPLSEKDIEQLSHPGEAVKKLWSRFTDSVFGPEPVAETQALKKELSPTNESLATKNWKKYNEGEGGHPGLNDITFGDTRISITVEAGEGPEQAQKKLEAALKEHDKKILDDFHAKTRDHFNNQWDNVAEHYGENFEGE